MKAWSRKNIVNYTMFGITGACAIFFGRGADFHPGVPGV